MWKAIVKLWKEDLSYKEFSKEIDKHFWKPNLFILYFIILLGIFIGLMK